MLLRRLSPLVAVCALVLVLPVVARAASVQVLPLESASGGIAVGADGRIHVIEPFAAKDAIFAADGTRVGTADLPAGATNAAVGPDGKVWVATSAGIARVDGNGGVITAPTPLGCPPAGLVADAASNLMLYSAPSNGGSCAGTHGLGELNGSGTSVLTDTTVPDAFDLAIGSGLLFAPIFDGDVIKRYAYHGSIVPQATIDVPGASQPAGIAIGPDGKVYVSLYGSGQVARFDQGAADGTDATIVASGLHSPYGIAAGPRGDVTIASHDDGRLVQIGPPGIPHDVALPAGFRPRDVAVAGEDVWVTDDEHARVARVVDGAPTAQVGAPAGLRVPLQIDPHGNDTHWTVSATRDGTVGFGVANGDVPAGIGPQAVDADLGALVAMATRLYGRAIGGDYRLMTSVTNRWGSVSPVAAGTVHLDDQPAAAPPVAPLVAKAPKLADLVTLASAKRCVATRSLKLTVRKPKAGGPKVASLRVTVGKGKAKTYTAKQLERALTLKGLPKRGSFKIRVEARLAGGTRVTQTITYKICAPKAKHKAKAKHKTTRR